ncbi:hypothetical protein PCANC_15887 [Puccinia coronata f. sp. avenae]|uniref:C2H2-type domain-containing protein n=1 Tax=Puccinia coronata f. sp. avenae TaxID=200324 RepID=A0A2N5UMM6_9BASI|nr:hypothetical protein PCANC_15887 [Puccinia coronata f. sp. avenae]
MTDPERHSSQTPNISQPLPDFDLDVYHHLFSQDLPHSSSLELDYSQLTPVLPPTLQLSDSVDSNPSSLSLSWTNSSSSSTGSISLPSSAPASYYPSCSPSWSSSLDQLFLASLPYHHPDQSSPLFPFDFIPNASPNLVLEQTHHQPINQPTNLSDFSFDAHLHDWNLSFDPAYSSYSPADNLQGYQTPDLRSSERTEYTEIDPNQITQPFFLEEQGASPSEQYLKDTNCLPAEVPDYGDFLLSSLNTAETNLPSPSAQPSALYTPPVLSRKRGYSPYSHVEDEASILLGTADLSSGITHNNNNSIAVEHLIQSDKEALTDHTHPLQPKSKRPKNRTTTSSSRAHICPECGKSFPRVTGLTQHKLTHNGERPFPCGFEGCGKSFTTSSNMKRHWKTHA